MLTQQARVPLTLLLAKELPVTAKLVHIALSLEGKLGPTVLHSPSHLANLLGLSRPTVRNVLQHVSETGSQTKLTVSSDFPTVNPQFRNKHVTIPGGLLVERQVSPRAKILYGVLQATPMYERGRGQFTYTDLGNIGPQSVKTVKLAVRELVQTGWLETSQKNQLAPVRFVLGNPIEKHVKVQTAEMERRLRNGRYYGETLMRETLTLVVDSPDYVDNATFGFLKNPFTGESMQLDRSYIQGVAFEFNGPQHYVSTEIYTQDEFAKQQARDILKAAYCRLNNIRVIVITPAELSVEAMIRKVDGLLPLRDLRLYQAQVRYLNRLCSKYRQQASKWPTN